METHQNLSGYLTLRISEEMMANLTEVARRRATNGRALARQILDEGLRMIRYPGITFRQSGSGTREAIIEGHRLYIWVVVETVRDSTPNEAAEWLKLRPDQIQTAMDYYSEFKDEIDALIEENDRMSEEVRLADERRYGPLG